MIVANSDMIADAPARIVRMERVWRQVLDPPISVPGFEEALLRLRPNDGAGNSAMGEEAFNSAR